MIPGMGGLFGPADNGESVVLERAGQAYTNAHGQVIPGQPGPPETVDGVIVDVPKIDEPRDGIQNRTVADYVLFFPAGWTVGKDDVVTVRGRRCKVEKFGEPMPNAFTGVVFRTEVEVRRIEDTEAADG